MLHALLRRSAAGARQETQAWVYVYNQPVDERRRIPQTVHEPKEIFPCAVRKLAFASDDGRALGGAEESERFVKSARGANLPTISFENVR